MTSHPPRPALPAPRGHAARQARRRIRALVWKARFIIAAGALGLAAAVTVDHLQPAPAPFATIVVTDRPVVAGVPLTADDVRTTRVPPQAAPADALRETSAALGRVLVVPVSEGTVVSTPFLVRPDGPQGPAGTVVAAVRLGDPAIARVVGPGMHVDLLAPSAGDPPPDSAATAQHLARRALVLPGPLTVTPATSASSLTPADDDATDLILVAVTPEEASLLANASGWGAITAVVVQ